MCKTTFISQIFKKCLLLVFIFGIQTAFTQNAADSVSQEELITNLTVEEFTERINSGVVLLYLRADWCTVCKKQTPIINEIVMESTNKLNLLVIDTKTNPLINEYFEVPGLPLIYLYKNGKIVWNRIGLTEKKLILDQVNYFTK